MNIIFSILAIIMDRRFGDPQKYHPVIYIGTLISFIEKKWNNGARRRWKGALCVAIVCVITGSTVFILVSLAKEIHWIVWLAVEVSLISLALAQKSLQQAAMLVYNALAIGDQREAREKLSWIVGRDTAHLEESEIVRGVVETVSENTSDGVTAPLFYALLFGSTGAWIYKAINTLDSMIAYRNERYEQFGYVAAKLDDVANFIPSRITGLLIMLGTKNKTAHSVKWRLKQWYIDARKHPSPNSGFLEAATAVQLGIQLGGFNKYGGKESFRAYMGEPYMELNKDHILQSVQHMYRVATYFIVLGVVIYALSSAWCECTYFMREVIAYAESY